MKDLPVFPRHITLIRYIFASIISKPIIKNRTFTIMSYDKTRIDNIVSITDIIDKFYLFL